MQANVVNTAADVKGNLLGPAALLHGVTEGAEMSKLDGTLTLYHSFFWNGWPLHKHWR